MHIVEKIRLWAMHGLLLSLTLFIVLATGSYKKTHTWKFTWYCEYCFITAQRKNYIHALLLLKLVAHLSHNPSFHNWRLIGKIVSHVHVSIGNITFPYLQTGIAMKCVSILLSTLLRLWIAAVLLWIMVSGEPFVYVRKKAGQCKILKYDLCIYHDLQ
jgi:hypothetical protein